MPRKGGAIGPDRTHGIRSTYVDGCRCPPCKQAYAAYRKNLRQRHRTDRIPQSLHGTDNGYVNYSCRCRSCTTAHVSYRSR